jgi:hypothetical protein
MPPIPLIRPKARARDYHGEHAEHDAGDAAEPGARQDHDGEDDLSGGDDQR